MNESRKPRDDILLAWLVAVLVFTGLVAVYDTSLPKGAVSEFVMQSAWTVIGLMAYLVGRAVPSRWLSTASYGLFILSLVLMCLTISPRFGREINGADRWLFLFQIGSKSIMIQPAEIAKIMLILCLARLLSAPDLNGVCQQMRRKKYPVLALLAIFAPAVIAAQLQRDLGTAMIFLGVGVGMLFAGGLPLRRVMTVVLIVAVAGVVFVVKEPYRVQRVMAFRNPFATIDSTGYQLSHSLMGIGTGGIWGVGLGLGRAKEYLPAADTDFVFTTVAEETGTVGSLVVIGLMALVTWRIFVVAQRAQSMFLILVASGVGMLIALQSLLNLYVVTGMVPTTGVPLPFISQGGSSLVTMLFGVGMVQRVAIQPMLERKGESHARTSGGRGNGRTSVPRREHRRSVA